MQIKINRQQLADQINPSHRRDKDLDWDGAKVVATDGKTIVEAMDIRCYYTKSRVYACVWLSVPYEDGGIIPAENRVSGSGWAGGYGYDRQDAAIRSALEGIGIEIHHQEWPTGSGQWVEACEQIVRGLYPKALVKTIKVFS